MEPLNLSPNTQLKTVANFFQQYGIHFAIGSDALANNTLSSVATTTGGKMVVSSDMQIGVFLDTFVSQFGVVPTLSINGDNESLGYNWTIENAITLYRRFKEEKGMIERAEAEERKKSERRQAEANAQRELVEAQTAAREFEEHVREKKAEEELKKQLGWKYYLKPKHLLIAGGILLIILWQIGASIVKNVKANSQERKIELIKENIQDGDINKAMKVLRDLDKVGDEGAVIVQMLCSKGYLDEAITLVTQIHQPKINDHEYFSGAPKTIYKALLTAGRYDELWKFNDRIRTYSPSDCNSAVVYYKCIEDAVRDMCQKGNKAAAIQYMNEKASWFYTNVDLNNTTFGVEWKAKNPGYTKDEVVARLTNVINLY